MKEIWKNIPGFNGKYQASNFGNIINCLTNKKLKLSVDKDGYYSVYLSGKHYRAHRIIAKTFLGDFPELQINHKDGNKQNNNIKNLEWCTCQQNNLHRCRVLGYKGTPHHCKKVLCIETGKIYESISEACRQVGAQRANLINAINNKHRQKTTCGFHWQFVKVK